MQNFMELKLVDVDNMILHLPLLEYKILVKIAIQIRLQQMSKIPQFMIVEDSVHLLSKLQMLILIIMFISGLENS
jgi:hypothetical protein